MGDRRKQALRVQFDGKLRREFHGAKITSDAGLLAFRELDEAFRLTENGSAVLADSRAVKNTQHSILAMLRQSIYARLDAESKLVISYLVGGRDAEYAREFMNDVASRITTRVQLTSDGHHAYLNAVEGAFGFDVDYAQLVKTYGKPATTDQNTSETRYSPPKINGAKKAPVFGLPDREHISTSYIERQNLTLRMCQRRFTRLTNAFSKRIENHVHAVALHYFYYNFIRVHKTLGTTPAKAAGIIDREWTMEDLVMLLEDEESRLANGGRINREDRT